MVSLEWRRSWESQFGRNEIKTEHLQLLIDHISWSFRHQTPIIERFSGACTKVRYRHMIRLVSSPGEMLEWLNRAAC